MNKEIIQKYPYKWFGFWPNSENPINTNDFEMYIPLLEDFIDLSWIPNYKSKIIEYLKNSDGYAIMIPDTRKCELCDEQLEVAAYNTDGVWLWPSFLYHYVESHNIRLPEYFENHIIKMNFLPPQKVDLPEEEWPWPEKDLKKKNN